MIFLDVPMIILVALMRLFRWLFGLGRPPQGARASQRRSQPAGEDTPSVASRWRRYSALEIRGLHGWSWLDGCEGATLYLGGDNTAAIGGQERKK
jgi:hypothetical protein